MLQLATIRANYQRRRTPCVAATELEQREVNQRASLMTLDHQALVAVQAVTKQVNNVLYIEQLRI
jgi:hypothetical protein